MQLTVAAEAATDARHRAQDVLTSVERANAAAAIAVTLHVGDECPVCHHEITATAEHTAVPELHEAQSTLKLASDNEVMVKASLDAVKSAALKALSAVTSLESRCAELAEEVAELADAATRPTTTTTTTPGDGAPGHTALGHTSLGSVATLRDRAEAAEEALKTARTAEHELVQITAELADVTALHSRHELRQAALTTEANSWDEQSAGLEEIIGRFPDLGELQSRIARSHQAQATVDRLELALAIVRKTESASRNTHAGLEAKAEALAGQLAALDARCANHPSLSDAIAQQDAVREAAATREEAQKHFRSAKERCARNKASVQECIHAENLARVAFQQARDNVASLAPPPATHTSLTEQWSALVSWAVAQRNEMSIKQTEIDTLLIQLRDSIGSKRNERSRRVSETLGQVVAPDTKDVEIERLMTTALAATKGEIDRIERGRQRTADLRADETVLLGQSEVARKLGQLLSAKQFEQWLVATALRSLTAAASEILERLSGHEFGLEATEGNDFQVIDHHNADERRPVRSLSGGETFQASLALALALSQELGGLTAQPGRSLDSIFLDEGFGTLDPETLDTVAGTIESLGQDGRMVGIITHVRELAERVPVRFRVTKGERTSTIEMEGA